MASAHPTGVSSLLRSRLQICSESSWLLLLPRCHCCTSRSRAGTTVSSLPTEQPTEHLPAPGKLAKGAVSWPVSDQFFYIPHWKYTISWASGSHHLVTPMACVNWRPLEPLTKHSLRIPWLALNFLFNNACLLGAACRTFLFKLLSLFF